MQVSVRADYALRAAIELAAATNRRVTSVQLARAQNIPDMPLAAILTQLRRGNIARSQRGPDGGFWLARPASEISLADVIRAVDGQLLGQPGDSPDNVTYRGPAEPLRRVWVALRAFGPTVLETVTLEDIVSGELWLAGWIAGLRRNSGFQLLWIGGVRADLPATARRGPIGPVRPAAHHDRLRHRACRPAGCPQHPHRRAPRVLAGRRAVPFLADAVSYGASFGTVSRIHGRVRPEQAAMRKALWREVADGPRLTWQVPLLRAVMIRGPLVLRRVPEEMRGRVTSTVTIAAMALATLAPLLAGLLVEHVSASWAIGAFAATPRPSRPC